MTSSKTYRIVIVEPYSIIAQGLRLMIDDIKGFEVSAIIADSHYMERIASFRPDIVVINPTVLDMKKRGEIDELTAKVPQAALVALVYQFVDPEILKCFKATIDISDSREKITVKLRQLLDAGEPSTESTELSEREKEILVAVAKGYTNKSIAEQYHLSIHTVITHRKNLTRKTGIKSVSGLTVYAILNNLIDIKDVE